MKLDLNHARTCLTQFEFGKLFIEELGWDRHAQRLDVALDGQTFMLNAVAHKRGMVAYIHKGHLPDNPTRRKIEYRVARTAHEHIIIYADSQQTTQIWQWVKREPGKPTACREHTYHRDQPGDALLQKLEAIAFSLEEEASVTISDVTRRIRAAFDIERVTKRFYDRFKAEHAAFLDFIKGIPDDELHRWYASVMLNRLMFVYFIQKKGFLNGDPDYLRNKLAQTKGEGKNRFYVEFLCPLFFEGFAKKAKNRSADTNKLLGKVPYLNGGIFQRHQIEELHGETIKVADAAFEKLFDFFDQYQWHLDERPLRRDNEINPDVLGYIFEKYINQKQMGAYYTKEDITGYNSAYTIVPFLFEVARAKCKVAFEGESAVWKLLQADPDRYIYPAVKKGVELKLPAEIAAGIKDVSKRTGWNKPAPAEYALPTEIWREVVARRRRYHDLFCRLSGGPRSVVAEYAADATERVPPIQDINDFITYNLDIRQFAQDVIENSEPDLLSAFYAALLAITVLDPTCGSGAFLFAALNVLYPLYEACLNRMALFVEEWQRTGSKAHPNYAKNFKAELARLAAHHNEPYFILKTIIVNNLYGVDIMDEAVEICKLRLFLKLVAQVETADDIEPLPDIDFNIRAGNTLVGYATYDEVKRAVTSKLDFDNAMAKIEDKAALLQSAFEMFRRQQTELGGEVTAADKRALRQRLESLEAELNRYLATDYGVDANEPKKLVAWLHSHKPFHWFIEFYGIMKRGGFDVIIGNPPYISAAKILKQYVVKNLRTLECTDIYAWMLDRAETLLCEHGSTGMIVPLSLGFSSDFDSCRRLLFDQYAQNWFSSFGRIPSALFSFDVRVRNTIHIGHKHKGGHRHYTTRLHRWFEQERPLLFQKLEYATFQPELWQYRIPKCGSQKLTAAFESCLAGMHSTLNVGIAPTRTPHVLHFKKTAYNWLNFCRVQPPCYDQNGRPIPHTQFDTLYFATPELRDLIFLLLDGKLVFAFWAIVGDDFHVARWMFGDYPIDLARISKQVRATLLPFPDKLETAMENATSFKLNAGKKVGNYNLAKCRGITDQCDRVFSAHVGLTQVWDEIELLYNQMVRTDFDDETQDAEDA